MDKQSNIRIFQDTINRIENDPVLRRTLPGIDAANGKPTLVNADNIIRIGISAENFWDDAKKAGWIFPIPASEGGKFTGTQDFNTSRKNSSDVISRSHAGIDLLAVPGTIVLAMQSGVVVDYEYNFYGGTDAIAIKHDDGTIARYTEIKPSVRNGDYVNRGDEIGTIISNNIGGSSMLHLEVYYGKDSNGNLITTGDNLSNYLNNRTYLYIMPNYPHTNPTFMRRCDLLDPSGVMELPRK